MRFDKQIFFRAKKPGEYNPDTGNYGPDTVTETMWYASVTSSGVETLNLIYGGLKQGGLTLRIQGHYDGVIASIRIGSKEYRVDFLRKLPSKHVFVVSEVQ